MQNFKMTGMLVGLMTAVFAAMVMADGDQTGIDIDVPVFEEVQLATPEVIKQFDPRLKALWLEALQSPEMDMRAEAAYAIGKAHLDGMEGLEDCAQPLVDQLAKDKNNPVVAIGIVKALQAIDARDAAGDLLALATAENVSLTPIINRTLADWNSQPAREVWRKQIAANNAGYQVRLAAAEACGQVGDERAVEPLLSVAMNDAESLALRIAAGQALGQIASTGMLESAKQLAAGDMTDRLVAAYMLQGHSDTPTQTLLVTLSQDEESVVVAVAYKRLLEVNFDKAREYRSQLSQSADPNVRLLAAQAIATVPDAQAVSELNEMLNDPSLTVRRYLRETLIKFGKREALAQAVRQDVSRTLNLKTTQSWRAIEQAAAILGKLDYEPAADRLVELMQFPRFEVRLAATVALRWIAVEKTLPDMHKQLETLLAMAHAKDMAQAYEKASPPRTHGETCSEMTELAQAMGLMKYQPADEVLRQFIPKKSSTGEVTRSAAIWALGHIFEGQNDAQPELVELLKKRYGDNNQLNPEYLKVRQSAGIAMVLMGAKQHLGVMVWHYKQFNDTPELAGVAMWANERFTGKKLDPLNPIIQNQSNWFLVAVGDKKSESQ